MPNPASPSTPSPPVRHRFHDDASHRSPPCLFPSGLPRALQTILFSDLVTAAPALVECWEPIVPHLLENGLAGLALTFAQLHNCVIPLTVRTILQREHFHLCARSSELLVHGRNAIDLLSGQNIRSVVIKGPGITLAAGSISERPFTDIDILVERKNFRMAFAVLTNAGFHEKPATTAPWTLFNLHCREAVNLVSSSGVSIDLHHTIPPWLWSRGLSAEYLLQAAVERPIGSHALPVLTPELNFLVACLHIFSDKSRPGQSLHIWRDILLLSRYADQQSLVHQIRRSGMTGWVAWVLNSLPEQYRPCSLLAELRTGSTTIPARRRLILLTPPHRLAQHQIGHAFRIPLPRGLLFLCGLFLPSSVFLRSRFGPQRGRLVHWWRQAPQTYRQEARRQADRGSLHAKD